MAVIQGTEGNDVLQGGQSDIVEGLGGDDTLFGSGELRGGEGNDLLDTNSFSILLGKFMDGGNGNDTISYSSLSSNVPLYIDLLLPTNQVSLLNSSSIFRGNLISIENVIAGEGNDRIIGDDFNNRLNGSEGDDVIYGGSGDDFLEGSFGNNYLNGGFGIDTAIFRSSRNQYNITSDGETITVEWLTGENIGSTDILYDIEKLQFSDGTIDNDFIDTSPDDNENDTLLNIPLNRFRNKFIGGTYLFAGEEESANIIENYSDVFILEGEAFKVANQPADGLIKFNRFANLTVSGTYLFASEEESVSIRRDYSNVFREEGVAFYAYGADANKGKDYYRLANTQIAGTYLFVNQEEKESALAQYPNIFVDEGIAFEVG